MGVQGIKELKVSDKIKLVLKENVLKTLKKEEKIQVIDESIHKKYDGQKIIESLKAKKIAGKRLILVVSKKKE